MEAYVKKTGNKHSALLVNNGVVDWDMIMTALENGDAEMRTFFAKELRSSTSSPVPRGHD
jgi:hypothetical protein